MNLWKNLIGTINSYFRVGLTGPRLKNNTGNLDVRNSGDSDYAVVRVKTPVGDNDAVTKKYADSLEKPLIVKRQANCTAAIPPTTLTRGYVVVTTAGSGAVIGDILYDDGLAATGATMEILAAAEGRTIAVTDALGGGTVTFDADSIYLWDTDGGSWIKIGDIGSVTGAIRRIRYTVTTATADSVTQIPANGDVVHARLNVTTPYSAGATISIGTTGSPTAFMATTDNNALVAEAYEVEQDTDIGVSASVVRTTISGSPAAGAATISVFYNTPNV